MEMKEKQYFADCGEGGAASLELTLARGKASFLFPPVTVERTEAGERLCYDLQGLRSLDELFTRDLAEFREALRAIPDAAVFLEDFLFDLSHISWEPETIFWNPARKEILFLLDPCGEREGPSSGLFAWAAGKAAQAVAGEPLQDESILAAVHLAASFRQGEGLGEAVRLFEAREPEPGEALSPEPRPVRRLRLSGLFGRSP